MIIRNANPSDAAALFGIKQQLPLPAQTNETTTGGFLLGTDEETYRQYIQLAHCLVAENRDGIKGFGIMFPDAVIRGSELWQKRNAIQWDTDIRSLETKTLCYFEQLAFLPGYRRWASLLSFALLRQAFDAGCEYMLTTVVRKPVRNLAAVPFIEAAGGHLLGSIDETYPVTGPIHSDVYGISRENFYQKTAAHPLYNYVLSLKTNEPAA